MERLCTQLSLRGRVRIARDGINATLGGTLAALKEHARQVAERYNTTEIDFKLSESAGKKSEAYAEDSGFNSLNVTMCKEVVSFGLDAIAPHVDLTQPPDPAPRISPAEFHTLLQAAQKPSDTEEQLDSMSVSSQDRREVVLLDCRNLYETRIGRFQAPNVTQLDPETRTFADLPAWIESNTHRLAGRQVLMYCTGGVRCERASAYLRSLGECFRADGAVLQLRGGIERYLDQFTDGGYFVGKNFVFDERGEKGAAVDFSARSATALNAPEEDKTGGMHKMEDTKQGAGAPCCCCGRMWYDYAEDRYRCGSCRMLVMVCDTCADAIASKSLSSQDLCCELCRQRHPCHSTTLPTIKSMGRKVRLLCLHGFRQTGTNFRGRTAALQKRLKEHVEFVFIDGPHTLPYVTRIKTDCEQGVSVMCKKVDPRGTNGCKRGWLVTPKQYEQFALLQNDRKADKVASEDTLYEFDENQFKFQTQGWDESYSVLRDALDSMGPFDGVLGFSQGASVAASMAAFECMAATSNTARFKFVILCSGYMAAVPKHRAALTEWRNKGGVPLPSLHVYTATEFDRQIVPSESEALWECFQPRRRALLRHSNGHLIPATRAAAARILDFIEFALTST